MAKARNFSRALVAFALLVLLVIPPQRARAYSVLSHEQVVDLAWKQHIVPLLQRRYPGITPEQIKEAHAYAYGGAIIQDLGYYPFGDKLLSDMLHYVRTGDFAANLVREAQNPNEYAFALGALAHYTSDTLGHPAVNKATADEYPKLRARYGDRVLYDENPRAHLQTEFGFDVLEVTQQRYAPEAYHDFIGFQVAKPVLERAFQDTYGIPLKEVLTKEDLAIGTYRKTVSILLPRMTEVAVSDYGEKMRQAEPTFVPRKLIYRMSRADYEKSWGNSYQRPGFGTKVLAFMLRLIPKVGPLKDLSLRVPSAEAQKAFLSGMDHVVDRYQHQLDEIAAQPPDRPTLNLPAVDLDTGQPTAPAEYALSDQTYARYIALLVKPRPAPDTPAPSAPAPSGQPEPNSNTQPSAMADAPQSPSPASAGKAELQPVDPAIKRDLEHYFAHAKRGDLLLKKKQWKELPKDLATLRQLPAAPPALATTAGNQ